MDHDFWEWVANYQIGRERFRRTFLRAMKKKPYSSPTIKELTPEQAKKIVADRKNCSEEEAVEFLEALKREQHRNEPLNDTKEKKGKRSA